MHDPNAYVMRVADASKSLHDIGHPHHDLVQWIGTDADPCCADLCHTPPFLLRTPIRMPAPVLNAVSGPPTFQRLSHRQNPARIQKLMKSLHKLGTCIRVEINHHIAAEDHIKLSLERPLIHQIQPRNRDERPQLSSDLKLPCSGTRSGSTSDPSPLAPAEVPLEDRRACLPNREVGEISTSTLKSQESRSGRCSQACIASSRFLASRTRRRPDTNLAVLCGRGGAAGQACVELTFRGNPKCG